MRREGAEVGFTVATRAKPCQAVRGIRAPQVRGQGLPGEKTHERWQGGYLSTHKKMPGAPRERSPGRRDAAPCAGAYLATCSFSPATPAATLSPVFPSMLSGWSVKLLLKPPTSTLAPAPTPAEALAVTPP